MEPSKVLEHIGRPSGMHYTPVPGVSRVHKGRTDVSGLLGTGSGRSVPPITAQLAGRYVREPAGLSLWRVVHLDL